MAVGPMAAPLDPEALAAFMQQLGIHPSEADDFGWIAEVGLRSPLPPRWTSHTDESTGYIYYIDHDRQASAWENPLVPYLRRVVEIGRAYLAAPKEDQEGFFEEQRGLLWHHHKQDLECWHGPFPDAEGRHYFVNSIAGVSSWQDPRVDAQYMFELESGLLTTLQEVLPPPSPTTPGFGDWAQKWNTADGAEVLTLVDANVSKRSRQPGSALSRIAAADDSDVARIAMGLEQRSMAEKMSTAAEQVGAAQRDEEEAQRLQILKKAEERKRRLRKAAAVAAAAYGSEGRGEPATSSGDPAADHNRFSGLTVDPTADANPTPATRKSLLSGKLSPSNEDMLMGPPRQLFGGGGGASRLPPIPQGAMPSLPSSIDEACPRPKVEQPSDLATCFSNTLS
mmetsp:Transcript_59836/g.110796  ORF Transcript_59836/g.110796 Transcript_59836/m.110796 type:complete len:395 (-) Transcript_59836:72-1256(-)